LLQLGEGAAAFDRGVLIALEPRASVEQVLRAQQAADDLRAERWPVHRISPLFVAFSTFRHSSATGCDLPRCRPCRSARGLSPRLPECEYDSGARTYKLLVATGRFESYRRSWLPPTRHRTLRRCATP